jgi:hypothetical protein
MLFANMATTRTPSAEHGEKQKFIPFMPRQGMKFSLGSRLQALQDF